MDISRSYAVPINVLKTFNLDDVNGALLLRASSVYV